MSKRPLDLALPIILILALLAACAGATEPAPGVVELEGTRWVLETLNGEPPLAGTELTLQFQEGIAGGSSGCNSFGGSYQVNGGELAITEISQTLMLCTAPEGVMEQEAAYLAALQRAAAFRLVGERLQIENAAGEAMLVFRPAE